MTPKDCDGIEYRIGDTIRHTKDTGNSRWRVVSIGPQENEMFIVAATWDVYDSNVWDPENYEIIIENRPVIFLKELPV